MTSTVRYYSFKDIPWARKQPSITIILAVMLVGIDVALFRICAGHSRGYLRGGGNYPGTFIE